jgi:ADP-ribose pyrophosphatase
MARSGNRPSKVEVLRTTRLLDDFFVVEESIIRHEMFDGSITGDLRRLCLNRGDAAACLPYDPARRLVFFVEQFRWPPRVIGESGWLVEIPAGLVAPGEDPADCMRRELLEETGLAARDLRHILTYFASPGGSTERIFLYLASVDGAGAEDRLAGQTSEHEDIRVMAVPYGEAWAMAADGRIADGKTLLALLAFRDETLGVAPTRPARGD